uniref:Uncharacterized protein n=1 Tax=Ditylenchus dipsaci TaxID=166011 RepID=A0A915ECX0_9BILA
MQELNCPAKIVIIVPNKMHHIRSSPKISIRKIPRQIKIFVRHSTAKTPRFTVLYNEVAKMSMDDLQGITYQLCYGHQIVGEKYLNEWWRLPHSEPDENTRYTDLEALLCYHHNEVFGGRRINA